MGTRPILSPRGICATHDTRLCVVGHPRKSSVYRVDSTPWPWYSVYTGQRVDASPQTRGPASAATLTGPRGKATVEPRQMTTLPASPDPVNLDSISPDDRLWWASLNTEAHSDEPTP